LEPSGIRDFPDRDGSFLRMAKDQSFPTVQPYHSGGSTVSQLALRTPTNVRGHPAAIRYALGGLLAFGALNAFAGGYYGMAGAEGVPREWLEGSPFDNYFIPSLVLFVVVGGSFLAAAIAIFAKLRVARSAAFAAGAIVLGWLAVETAIIGYASWMQPATTIGGLLVLLFAWLLPREAKTT
jgi:hypothetical protein